MKKRSFYKILSFLMTTLILITTVIQPMITKADSAATFQDSMLVLTPVGIDNANPDFFKEYANNLVPGDNITFAITLKNVSSERVKFYFWASDTDFSNDEISKEISDELLSLIRLKIDLIDDSTIYDGPASGKGDTYLGASKISGTGRADAIPLGTLESNTSTIMKINIQVPTTLGNEFQLALAAVDWTFLCEIYEDTTPPPTEPPTSPPTTPPTEPPTTPTPTEVITPSITPIPTSEEDETIDIEEDDVPEGTVEIEEEDVPEGTVEIEEDEIPEGIIVIDDDDLGKLPQTGTVSGMIGNTSQISTIVFLLLVVCFILGVIKNRMKNTSN